ncbi:hypothetical protein ACEPAI_8170 [Sanghuangporus weigelae]
MSRELDNPEGKKKDLINERKSLEHLRKSSIDLFSDSSETFDLSCIPDASQGLEPFSREDIYEMLSDPFWREIILEAQNDAKTYLDDICRLEDVHEMYWWTLGVDPRAIQRPEPHNSHVDEDLGIFTDHHLTNGSCRRDKKAKVTEACIDPSLIFS